MRLILAADQWDYGDPARGHSFEWDTFYQTLALDGHDVLFVDVAEFRAAPPEVVEDKLRRTIEGHRAEMLFCVLFGMDIPAKVLQRVRDEDRVPVANWFCDDHWRYDDFSRKLAPALSLSVTTSSAAEARYRRDGYRVLQSQWGYADKVYGRTAPVEDPDPAIVFVGQPYGRRGKTLDALDGALPNGGRLVRYGHGTPAGRIPVGEMIALFNKSAAAINFSASWQPGFLRGTGPKDAGLASSIIHRQYLPRRRPTQLKARVFEVTGAGGLLLTEPSEDLEDNFAAGREMVVFRKRSELIDAAREALSDRQWRHAVATAGFERCHREHTMTKRLERVLEVATS